MDNDLLRHAGPPLTAMSTPLPHFHITDYDSGISAIDAEYYRPGLAAIHLIVEERGVALVDTGTSFSVRGVMEALKKKYHSGGRRLHICHAYTS